LAPSVGFAPTGATGDGAAAVGTEFPKVAASKFKSLCMAAT
jgi:hypothetical protein